MSTPTTKVANVSTMIEFADSDVVFDVVFDWVNTHVHIHEISKTIHVATVGTLMGFADSDLVFDWGNTYICACK